MGKNIVQFRKANDNGLKFRISDILFQDGYYCLKLKGVGLTGRGSLPLACHESLVKGINVNIGDMIKYDYLRDGSLENTVLTANGQKYFIAESVKIWSSDVVSFERYKDLKSNQNRL